MQTHCVMVDKVTGHEIPLQAFAVKGIVNGLTVNWQIIQRFANNEKVAVEAVFTFPLPDDATLSCLKIISGEKTIVTSVEEREKAFEEYDEAIQQGNGAYLLDQERPDLFVMNLGNLLPGQQAEVQISMFQLLKAQAGGGRIAFPVAVVPKYFPASAKADITEWERITPEFASRVPYGFSFALKIMQQGRIRVVESPSHKIRVEYNENEADISLYQQQVMPDTDVVVNFELAEKLRPVLSHCRHDGREHLLLEMFPEFTAEEHCIRCKEIVFVVDCSGSMGGEPIREAVNALQLCIRSLNEGDRFQVICFGSSWRALFDRQQVLDDTTLKMATAKIAGIDADMGGTEILSALAGAVKSLTGEFADLIVFTDGAVGNESEVFDLVAAHSRRCRFFSFGIGNGASASLINGIAARGNGCSEFIFPGERIEPKVLRQFNRIAAPFLNDITLTWSHPVEQAPTEIQTIFNAEVFRISARCKNGKPLPADLHVELKAKLGDREISFTAERPVLAASNVPALYWAKKRIEELENTDAAAGSRQRRTSTDKKAKTIIELSKNYGIISSLTSMIGVEERSAAEKNDGRVELRRVPVMVPAGRPFMNKVQAPVMQCYDMFAAPPDVAGLCCFEAVSDNFDKLDSMFDGHKSRARKALAGEESRAIPLPPPAPVPAGKGVDNDRLVNILMHAGADGMFGMSEELLTLIDASVDDFTVKLGEAPQHLSPEKRGKYAMTLMVISYLARVYGSQKDMWSAIIAKSERKVQQWETGGGA